MGEAQSSLQ
jgi:hypothetical protein